MNWRFYFSVYGGPALTLGLAVAICLGLGWPSKREVGRFIKSLNPRRWSMKKILTVGLLLALLGIAASSLTGCVQGDLSMGGGGSSSADNSGSNNPNTAPAENTGGEG